MAAAILAAVGLGLAIAGVSGAFDDSNASASGAAESINELSNSIYQLENKASNLETIIDSYNELDKQIIKTQADQEEMNTLLDQAADKLTDEEATVYKALVTNNQKINFLKTVRDSATTEANVNREEQLSYINNLSASERAKLLATDATDSEILSAQSALYAINNKRLYEYIDALGDAQEGVETLAQSLLEKLTPAQALLYANSPEKINALAKALNNINKTYTSGENETGVAGVLTSDDYTIVQKVDAYREAVAVLDEEMRENLADIYSDIATFATFNETVLKFIDNQNIATDGLITIGKAINKLGYEGDAATQKLENLFNEIARGTDIASAIDITFGALSDEEYRTIINAYSNAVGTGILNMGQNITALKNQIDSFYDKAAEWSTMSDTDKTSFLADNAELFAGEQGKQLLDAIKSGDYNFIAQALGDNETLKKKVAQQIQDIDTEIAIEMAKLESDRDLAYIEYLKDEKAKLEDVENLYAASLETRLEQEQQYLDEYKSYLEAQRDALKESLEDRQEAYQNYFDAVNQNAEDEDFEEQESTLIANIAKLATSTSAEAVNQTVDLEQQLKDLEEERLQTLRERAQDEIMDSIEQTLNDIDDKFDELLNSQSALLAAMTGELNDPSAFLTRLITNKVDTEGLTQLGLQDYIQDLQTTYGSVLGNDIFNNMSVEKQGEQLILNIAGTEVILSNNDQQSIYEAIMNALKQVGLR